jgi:hypothetical protein
VPTFRSLTQVTRHTSSLPPNYVIIAKYEREWHKTRRALCIWCQLSRPELIINYLSAEINSYIYNDGARKPYNMDFTILSLREMIKDLRSQASWVQSAGPTYSNRKKMRSNKDDEFDINLLS